MGVCTVARDDFRNGLQSYFVLGVVLVFVGVTALVFTAEIAIYDHPARALWDVQQAVILVEPVLVAALCYRAVVGDRTSGRVRFSLGLPNTRAEYFVGKVLARAGIVTLATVASLAAGYLVALFAFAKPPSIVDFALFAGTTTAFLLSLTSLFMAISAVVDSRPAAMVGAFAAYFLLVPFVLGITPFMSLGTLLNALSDLTGASIGPSTQQLVKSATPYPAYGGITNRVFLDIADQYDHLPTPTESQRTKLHAQVWFQLLVLVGWSLGSIVVGYVGFKRKDLT
ncbi:ABC transporter permease subunit [Halostella litorea]|uniref:ABC transporter permease subunit n=1 Tax=Halostella litorea TaxID=2528831 RepID=UPI001091FF0B|nr:ABC transporter permease subunit [Halostella litorea]